MRRSIHSKLLCIFLMISMLVLGIYCENNHNDSSFSHVFGEPYTASLQAADHIADTHVYNERSSLSLIEEFVLTRQSVRTSTSLRISQCMISALLMISAYLLSLSFRNSDLYTDGYNNQYNRRTLEYMHHNDGKKSH